jgi:hypothetical protein
MESKKIFLVIALTCLIGFVVLKVLNIEEGFVVTSPPASVRTTPPAIVIPDGCPTLTPPNWWEVEAPKQIVSYVTGVRFPIIALQPTKAINSSFQVPYIKAGDVSASGCIVVQSSGTFTTKMCYADSSEQKWKIVRVVDSQVFSNLLQAGQQYYSGISSNSKLPQGISFGFYMVISEIDPSMVLACNGGNLTVQRIGNYTSQFWDITKDAGNANIAVYDTAPYAGLSNSFILPQTQSNNQSLGQVGQNTLSGVSGLNTVPSPTNSDGTIATKSAAVAGTGQPFNINLNLDKASLLSIFGSLDTTGPGVQLPKMSSTGVDKFADVAPIGYVPSASNTTKKCKPCPSILNDYIAKNKIPCAGCKL